MCIIINVTYAGSQGGGWYEGLWKQFVWHVECALIKSDLKYTTTEELIWEFKFLKAESSISGIDFMIWCIYEFCNDGAKIFFLYTVFLTNCTNHNDKDKFKINKHCIAEITVLVCVHFIPFSLKLLLNKLYFWQFSWITFSVLADHFQFYEF